VTLRKRITVLADPPRVRKLLVGIDALAADHSSI